MTRGVLAIIGGTGFIGRAVARAAAAHGYQPIRLATSDPLAPRQGQDATFVDCDISDPSSLVQAFAQTAPGAAISLAAFGSGDEGLLAGAATDPAAAVDINVRGFVNTVDACAEHGVDRLVWSSSTTVYGPATCYNTEFVDERAARAPQTVYGATKAAAELLTESLELRTQVRAVGLRLPMVYGPGRWYGGSQDGLVRFVRDVAGGRPASLDATDTTADWIYEDDAASALLTLLDVDEPNHVYNVVGHRGSLADIGNAIAQHAVAPAEVRPTRDTGGLNLPLVDDRAFRGVCGFAPKFELDQAARDYVQRMEVNP